MNSQNKALIFIFISISAIILCITSANIVYPFLYNTTKFASSNNATNWWTNIIIVFCLIPLLFSIFCRNKYLRILFVLIISVLFISSLVDLMMLLTYGVIINPSHIMATFTSNSIECKQYILHQINYAPIYISLIVIYVFAIFCLLHQITFIKNSILYTVIFVFGILFSLFILYTYRNAKNKYIATIGIQNANIPIKRLVKSTIATFPPINALFNTYKACQLISNIVSTKNFSFEAQHNINTHKKELYLLLIGESLTSQRVFFDGNRITMPLIGSMERIVYFDNCYSTACYTLLSIPQIITRSTPDNMYLYQKERTILAPFKECDFYCAALIHNGQLLLEDNFKRLIVNDIDTLIAVNNDIEIANKIEELASKHEKIFILSQMNGSHFFYTNYDEQHNIFRPNINSDKGYKSDSLYINAYDNTILYTDSVLYSISQILDNIDCISAYQFVSDHGEYLCPTYGTHGDMLSSAEYQVPLIFWFSKEYQNTFNYKVLNAKLNKQKPINFNNIFYSILDMAEIKVSDKFQNSQYSIFNDNIKLEKRKVILSDHSTIIDVE